MNRLRKKAIQDFIAVCVFMLIAFPFFVQFVSNNTQGIEYALIIIIAGVPTGMIACLWEFNKFKQLDERERLLYQQANYWAQGVFVFYLSGFALVVFFLIGGKGMVPVWLLPMMVISGLFVAQTALSFFLFRQSLKEEGDE